MSIKINKNGKEYDLGFIPEHYPADRVYLDGDTSKTVQGEIDKLEGNKVATYTDITGYTSRSNMYQAPSDGYILIRNATGAVGQGVLYGSDNQTAMSMGQTQGEFLCFVKKGMRMYCKNSPTEGYFLPLS